MRAANAPAILCVYSQARPPGSSKPPPHPPPPTPTCVKPKRALLAQASMGIGNVIQPILVLVFLWAKLMRQYFECMRNAVSFSQKISLIPLVPYPIWSYRFARFCPFGCPSVCPSVTLACPGHTSYIIWGRNPKFGVWMHLEVIISCTIVGSLWPWLLTSFI